MSLGERTRRSRAPTKEARHGRSAGRTRYKGATQCRRYLGHHAVLPLPPEAGVYFS